jgi:sigma-B regulation protein RsbU (phosphoserine phosphatase)
VNRLQAPTEGRPKLRRGRRPPPYTIRFQLLLAVNAAMAVLVAAFLVLDYRRELVGRLEQKQIALEEEAKTILPAVLQLRSQGAEAVQEHLDAVCGRMYDAQSPGHHIAVRLGDKVLQSTAHGRASPAVFLVMEQASSTAEGRIAFGDREVVVGSARLADVTAYVLEDLTLVRRSVLGQTLWRLGGILLAGVVAAVVVSAALLRIIDRPLQRLVGTVHRIAAGDLAVRTGPFNSAELTGLSEAINVMGGSLEEADRKRRQEMSKARQIQEHLLPKSAEVPGLCLTALYRPASDVAGDYYDVLKLSDESWLLCVADVSGHGVPAAMSAAMLKAFLLHAAEHDVSPDKLLAFVNRRFTAFSPPDVFASMLLVRWNPVEWLLEYANAGHEPGWMFPAEGRLRLLEATGHWLGIEDESTWDVQAFEARPGDKLVLTTDGAAESLNPGQELFGRERLIGLLRPRQDVPPAELVHRIDQAVARHRDGESLADDMTILAVEFLGEGISVRQSRSRSRPRQIELGRIAASAACGPTPRVTQPADKG